MAPRAGTGCDTGLRGENCGFDEGLFSTVTAIVWILTALPLLAWAIPCLRREWSASRIARASLVLAAASALCCFGDDFLKVREEGYGNQTLWGLGSILLVFAICAFSTAWCDVASALGKIHSAEHGGERLISLVRATYWFLSLLHVPFAVMFALHDYEFMWPAHAILFRVWGAWLLFGTIIALSGLAAMQFYISRFLLGDVPGARSLQDTALINLVEQVLFDIGVVVYAALYASDNATDGDNITAYHSVGFVTYWAMHVQVVLFFAILGSTDPLYSRLDMDALLSKASENDARELPPTIVGSPQVNQGVDAA